MLITKQVLIKRLCLLFFVVFILSVLPLSCKRGERKMAPVKIVWDRDMCQRCLMAISDRKYAAEVINPLNGKAYKFDDIGCAILWLYKEKRPEWLKKAIIYVTDRDTGKWLDARRSYFTTKDITPMGFGFGATARSLPNTINFKQMKQKVLSGQTAQKRYFDILNKQKSSK